LAEAAGRGAPPRAAAIPFNRPVVTGAEHEALDEALDSGYTGGNGPIARRCEKWLEELTGAAKVLLTPSCTGALEMAALLLDVGPGDEVVMPSFTFVSTANAFVLRGATPVFVDIREDDLGLDPALVEDAVGERTRAIVPIHYGGGAARIEDLLELAGRRSLPVVEDAAQAVMTRVGERALGGFGDLGAFSFHETKNLSCGEGGALAINRADLVERAEMLQEKGTNRQRFVRGEVRAYTWVDLGSSFLLSDLSAALLWTQLERAEAITAERVRIWRHYHEAFEDLETRGDARMPHIPPDVRHNGHIFYLLTADRRTRDGFIAALGAEGIRAQFHYVPLHSSPAGRRFGRVSGSIERTDDISARLVRLPLWAGMTDADVERVVDAAHRALS
jgi:dTDP-4-amino-4,6-dideoxygalactose transaminase